MTLTSILWRAQIVEGKDRPTELGKKKWEEMGKTVGLMLQMCEPIFSTGKCVVTSTKVIQMRLPSWNLAENDEENVSVFENHLKKVLNNHKTTDTTVTNKINLQEVMGELDNPPLWT